MKFVPKPLVETADNSRGHQTWRTRLKGLVSAAIVLAVGYILLGWIGLLLASFIPDRWEKSFFNHASLDLLTGTTTDSEQNARAQAVLDTLIHSEGLRDLNYHLVIIDDTEPNAFAYPGGAIGVTTGLLEQVKSDVGLAFVLAHELAHHQHRHILKGMGRRLVIGAALSLIFEGDIIRTASAATDVGENQFSRKQETEADLFALDLAAAKYRYSTNLLEFLFLVDQQSDELLFQSFLGTHPSSHDRLSRLQEELKVLSAKPDSSTNPVP